MTEIEDSTDIDKLSPKELARFLAVEVMGWKRVRFPEHNGLWYKGCMFQEAVDDWNPLIVPRDRDALVDKMREKGWTVVLVCHCGGCVSCHVTSSDRGICEGGDADDLGTAVCKAAAKAIVAESKIQAEKEIE